MAAGCAPTQIAALLALAVACVTGQPDAPTEPLCRAALKGNFAQVRALLAQGVNVDVRDQDGETPLMRAVSLPARSQSHDPSAKSDPAAVVGLLLEHRADVNAADRKGQTALLLALDGSASEYRVIGADVGIVESLVEHGADVNARDNSGWSPLLKVLNMWADQTNTMDLLLARGADVNAQLKDGRTGLMLATRLGKSDLLPRLLARGARVNVQDAQGVTALMMAATLRWDEQAIGIMKLLVSSGADLNSHDKDGKTALDRASEAGYLDRAKLLLDSGTSVPDKAKFLAQARNWALLRAISSQSLEDAAALLKEGASPDVRDSTGRTLLMLAASNEYSPDKLILLLSHGAAVNAADPDGNTALMIAADTYQAASVEALLAKGANPNATDRHGNTVLMRAAASRRSWQEEKQPLIHILLEHGATIQGKNEHGVTALMLMAGEGNPALPLTLERVTDVDARDDQGNTALLHAARYFVRGWQRRNGWALLEKGANVDAANLSGETAIILASTQYEVEAVELLLLHHANLNSRTRTGRTALMQAIDGPKEFDNDRHIVFSPAIAKALIAAGADVNARDAQGDSALSLALRRGYADIAAFLIRSGAK